MDQKTSESTPPSAEIGLVEISEECKEEEGSIQSSMETQQKEDVVCRECATRLFHIESNTQIDAHNRKKFIADGDMYDAIAKLCQENAHEVMQEKYGLVWMTLCPPEEDHAHPLKKNKHEPIRALVNPEQIGSDDDPKMKHFRKRPTLLIMTGKGKVRAGIFSRQYLLVSGMESSTALPLIHEARQRQLNLVIIDPNCHGDAMGMVTFQKSMEKAFHHWENDEQQVNSCRDLLILSHSASGAHLVRYLLEKSKYYVPHIRAIAFTDATHNVQWARQRGNQPLVELLESPACVYFRCANPDKDSNWAKRK